VGGSELTGQRDDLRGAQQWDQRRKATSRDLLLSLKLEDWTKGPAQNHPAPLVQQNSWHWVRDVPLREDAHRYREFNGVQIWATLRNLAINALRIEGIWSITEDIATLTYDIRALRLLGWGDVAMTPSG